jgi:hypothetical protein
VKIEFRFNGASQAILIPETSKDKQLLQLWNEGRPNLRVVPNQSNPDCIVIEAFQVDEIKYCQCMGGQIIDKLTGLCIHCKKPYREPTAEDFEPGRTSLLDRKNLPL